MSVENRKSLKINMFLNMARGLLGAVFPLITFPYVTRILGVENIGKFSFANSIVSYFILLAGLGINTYAVARGAALREDGKKLELFASEVFSINIAAMIISYLLMFFLLLVSPQLGRYSLLIIVLSIQIAFKTIGIEWLYTIYEEFSYITIRTIVFQLISLILMFLFVKTESDVLTYAFVSVVAAAGSNLLNLIHSRKYISLKVTSHCNLRKHLRPIIVLFATAVTVTIYVSSDTTILGLLCGDREVGIYTVSVKVYTLLKTVLSSAIVVSIPRMAKLYEENNIQSFAVLGNNIYKTFITFIVPSMVGVACLSQEIVKAIAGQEYISAWSSLDLLSLALFFCLGAGFWSQAVMIPQKKEHLVLSITVISAIVNIAFNIMLIPIWGENAAAFTTIIAEAIVFIYCRHKVKYSINKNGLIRTLIKSLVGSLPFVLWITYIKEKISNEFIVIALSIAVCVTTYIVMGIIMKNEVVINYYKTIKVKIVNRNHNI